MNKRIVSTYSDVEALLQAPPEQLAKDDSASSSAPLQAKQFLGLLDPEATAFTFQTFGEASAKGEIHLTEIHHGSLSKLVDDFCLLNHEGAGIFVTVNKTDFKGRKAENIRRVRAIWCDYDSEKQTEPKTLDKLLEQFPLQPSIIVSTSEGNFHFYWLIADGMGWLPFDAIMQRMVESYGSDKSARDRARVLRLPGYRNQKRQGWHVSIIKDKATGTRYTRNQLIKAFPPVQRGDTALTAEIARPERAPDDWEGEKERIKSALRCVPADDRDTWFRYGGAIFDFSDGSEEGFQIWDEWSQTTKSKNYDAKEQRRYWEHEFAKPRKSRTTIASIYRDALANGRDDPSDSAVTFEPVVLPPAVPLDGGELTAKTMARMRQLYRDRGLQPSDIQWIGIQDAIGTMEAMANRKATSAVYLSSLDPGVGKTQSVINFIPCLLASKAHEDVAAIICVGRLKEIATYVQGMALGEDDYAVIVYDSGANAHLNRMGNQSKKDARVLFTTQQMLESRAKRAQGFSAITAFHYKGTPRQIRIWDEAMLPAKPVLVNVTLVEGMTNTVKPYPKLLQTINDLLARVRASKDKEFVDVPDFAQVAKVDSYEAQEIFEEDGARDEVIDAVADLWSLSGRTVCVRRDYGGNTILDYETTLLEDLKPILVLDASGRVRQTYKYWREGRGGLLQLRSATKNYANLTPHVWRRAGSKQAWKDDRDELARAIGKEILREPQRRCLVIHPMRTRNFKHNVPAYINAHLPHRLIGSGIVEYLHWGDHAASNDYRDRDKIILATVMFREPSYYEAMARGSMGLKSDQSLEKKHYDEIMRGERADVILQAVCRGAVRKPLGDGCQPCDLYIIAARKQGIEDLLPIVFPGCKSIVDWSPVERELPKRVAEARRYIVEWLGKHPSERLRFSEVYGHFGMDKSNFYKDVYNHPDFEGALAKEGIFVEEQKGKHGNCFVKRGTAA